MLKPYLPLLELTSGGSCSQQRLATLSPKLKFVQEALRTHIDKRSSTNGFAFGALKVWRRGVETLVTVTRLYMLIVLLKAGAADVVVGIAIVIGAPIRIGKKI